MKIHFISLMLVLLGLSTSAQKIKLSRVCNDGNNNTISWQVHADSCVLLNPLHLWASDAAAAPFFVVDSMLLSAAKSYIHIDANVPSTKDWKYFLRYKRVCNGDTGWFSTDTVYVDTQKPDSTILDSVSVDPITGVIYLGWTSNKTPDFSSYYLYNYDRTDPRLQENYKDTFYTDLTPVNPSTKSLSYDITSADSCNNRKEYGKYKHMTMCLKGNIDTCKFEQTLTWNSYVGWPVRTYEIYRSTNGAAFQLIDSTTTTGYTDRNFPSNAQLQYFIRARKADSFKNTSSTSNGSPIFRSSVSVKPSQTGIKTVTNNNNDKVEISIVRNPSSNYSAVDLWQADDKGKPQNKIHSFGSADISFEDLSVVNTNKNNYVVMGIGVCGQVSDTSAMSHNIVLFVDETSADYTLRWLPYSTWNNGVENYTIYRSSGNSMSDILNYSALQTLTDTAVLILKDDTAVHCYYVLAHEKGGNETSKSNTICVIRSGNIYYPNAIVIGGINSTFMFIGDGVDLNKSSLQVYDRWGGLVYSREGIANGWPGTNNNGEELPVGVYFFTAKVFQGKDYSDIHGNITILK